MLVVRQGYGCDCDGVSHESHAVESTLEHQTVRCMTQAHLGAIESLIGIRPQTCPWRALYHPLVIEVVDLCMLGGERGLAATRAGADPPAILLDAVVVYETARSKALSHNLEQRKDSKK
jgi:hypothetical protein